MTAESERRVKGPMPPGDLRSRRFTEADVSPRDTQMVADVHRVIAEAYDERSEDGQREHFGEFLGGQLSALDNALGGISRSQIKDPYNNARLLSLDALLRLLNRAEEDVVKLEKGALFHPENRPFYSVCLKGYRDGFRWIMGIEGASEPLADQPAPQTWLNRVK